MAIIRLSTFLLIMLNLLTREPLIGSVRTSLGKEKREPEGATDRPPNLLLEARRYNGGGFEESSQNRLCHNGSAGLDGLHLRLQIL